MDYLIEIERAKAVTEQAMNDAKSLAERLPDGLVKVAAFTLVSQLVQATVMLSIRRPAVPCRLDFVSEDVPSQPAGIPDVHADSYQVTKGYSDKSGKQFVRFDPMPKELTEQQMLDRVELLGDEMDANDEENRAMQSEIDTLYAKIDAAKIAVS
jgi:hypothetical protein